MFGSIGNSADDVLSLVADFVSVLCRCIIRNQNVAERMRTTVRSILLLNPDLESQLLAGAALYDLLCVRPCSFNSVVFLLNTIYHDQFTSYNSS